MLRKSDAAKLRVTDDPSGNIAHGCTGAGGGDVAYLRGGLVHRTVGLAHTPSHDNPVRDGRYREVPEYPDD